MQAPSYHPNMREMREHMVEMHIANRGGINDLRVIEAMRRVPRHAFIDAHLAALAYLDRPLPIDDNQTALQPSIVARIAAAARLAPGENVLEVGTGCGYAAAVLSRLCTALHTIEQSHVLADRARDRLKAFAYHNVFVKEGDGTRGLPEAAPFDVIIVEAGARSIPTVLLDQLKLNGRMIIPLGNLPDGAYDLMRITRLPEDRYTQEALGPVRMDPLIGWEHAIPMPAGDSDDEIS